jgi:CheY-like chemotaxis protein
VTLPRGKLQDEVIKAPPPDLKILRQVSILLAEDNLFNQQVAVELLHEVGCTVTIANNGQEAIDMLLKRRFNCVLMDVQMPVMDGLEATRKIRAHPLLADTYIIAMTANAGKEDRVSCEEAGMNAFVSKPVFADQLYALIAQGVGAAAGKAAQLPAPGDMHTDIQKPPVNIPAPGIIDRSAVMDLSVLGKMVGNDPDKIRKFSLKFLQSAQAGMAEIKQALQQENWGQLAALGHRHKSPARTVGAHSYADLCVLLESFKQGGDAGQAHKIIEQMDELLLQIEKEINRDTV